MARNGIAGINAPGCIASPAGKGMALVTSGSILAADLRLASVATGALFWADALDLSAYAGGAHLLELSNAGGTLRAYTGAVGAGEAAPDELVGAGDCANSGTAPYDTFDGASPTGFHAIRTSAGTKRAGSADQLVVSTGWLVKLTSTLTLTSGTAPQWSLGDGVDGPTRLGSALMVNGANTMYGTNSAGSTQAIMLWNGANTEFTVANLSGKRVTVAPATGFALRSLPGLGGAQSVLSNSGLTPNITTSYRIFKL